MDIYGIRKNNLKFLLETKFPGYGSQVRFSEAIGWQPQRTSALMCNKNMGRGTAREIEVFFSLDLGWMDAHHESSKTPDSTMVGSAATRKKNLRFIVDQRFPGHGQKTKLAKLMGCSQPRASAILGSKNIGSAAARNLESILNLESGWLDSEHPELWGESETPPIIPMSEVAAFVDGETPKNIPTLSLMPGIPRKPISFIITEETNALSPIFSPGDLHFIEIMDAPITGQLNAFILNGACVVGVLEKGSLGYRLTFSNPREPSIDVNDGYYVGTVALTLKAHFIERQLSVL